MNTSSIRNPQWGNEAFALYVLVSFIYPIRIINLTNFYIMNKLY